MSTNSKHTDFSTFRKYYTGEMSAKEKSAFETNLENDPFAKDAFDGFLFYEKDFDKISSIEKTNMAFKEKLKLEAGNHISLKPILAIAASVVVLFSAFYIIQNNAFKNNTVAKNETKTVFNEEQNQETFIEQDEFFDSTLNDVYTDEDIFIEDVEEETKTTKDNIATVLDKEKFNTKVKDKPLESLKKQTAPDYFYDNNEEAEQEEIAEDIEVTVNTNEKPSLAEPALYNSIYYKEENNTEIITPELNNFKAGLVDYNQSKYNAAIKNFEASINNKQKATSSKYYIGMSYFNLNKHNKAISYFDKVIGTSSTLADDAMWYKSLALINKGQKNKAKDLLQAIIDINSSFKTKAQKKLNSLN